jgi:septal ring factor EnvC (AmiA/AmiB activator)
MADLEHSLHDRRWAHEDRDPLPQLATIGALTPAILEAVVARLHHSIEALERKHAAEKAQLRAEFEAERARLEAELARSEHEKAALHVELDDTKHDNRELMFENEVLRYKLGADPLQRTN